MSYWWLLTFGNTYLGDHCSFTLSKERSNILIVKTWVWVSWVELDSLMPICSIIVGSSINLLVVHKWYSSSRGGLALKSERDSWYQWDGAAVINRVISVFRGQLCSGLCLFVCHSRKWSRHCHCCCWCICCCYYDFLNFLMQKKWQSKPQVS